MKDDAAVHGVAFTLMNQISSNVRKNVDTKKNSPCTKPFGDPEFPQSKSAIENLMWHPQVENLFVTQVGSISIN